MLIKTDWEILKGLNPPLIEDIIDDCMNATAMINKLLEIEIKKENVVDIIEIRESIHGISNNIMSIIKKVQMQKEKLQMIRDDLTYTEKKLEDIEEASDWITSQQVYTFLQKLLFILSTFYHSINETKKEMGFPEKDIILEIRKKFYQTLNLLNQSSFYFLCLESEDVIWEEIKESLKKLASLISEEKQKIFFEDMRKYSYLTSLGLPTKEEVAIQSSFGNILNDGMGCALDVDLFSFAEIFSTTDFNLTFLTKFDQEEVTRIIYGLSDSEILKYYGKLNDAIERRSGWAVAPEEEEKPIKIEEEVKGKKEEKKGEKKK